MKSYSSLYLGDVVKTVQDRWPDRGKWHFDKYVAGEHIKSEEIRIRDFGLIKGNEEVIGPAFHMRFRPNDVLYSTRRAYLRKAGIVNFEGICSNVTLVLRADQEKLLQSLLPFILQTEDFVQFAISRSIGSTNPFVKWSDLSRFELKLPHLEHQKRISELLWAVEYNQEKLEKLIDLAQIVGHTIFHTLLSKGLRHRKYKTIRLLTKDVVVPVEWEVKKLSSVADIHYGLNQPPTRSDDGIPMIRASNIKGGKIIDNDILRVQPSSIASRKVLYLKDGDIIVVRSGAYTGEAAIVTKHYEGAIAGYDLVIRPSKLVNPMYLIAYIRSTRVQRIFSQLKTRAAQGHLNHSQLSNIEFPIPPIGEQEEIARIFVHVDRFRAALDDYMVLLKQMKKKLINHFLSARPFLIGEHK